MPLLKASTSRLDGEPESAWTDYGPDVRCGSDSVAAAESSEWNRKAAAFVSYGSAIGVRSVQQLRQTMTELQVATIRSSVHVPVATLWAHYRGGDVDAGLAELGKPAEAMIDDLLWWTAALKTARASAS